MSLYIYNASAGSGKTHTLVKEYLKIALKNPKDKFKHILAITFTNKAAGEMKERIIESLKNFASNLTNDSLAEELKKELSFNDEKLKKSSTILLEKIVHSFDDFNISTIDSFVHKTIRTFSKDVKLPSNFEVVIDIDDIIPEIIEEIYDRLDYTLKDNFTKFMVDFVNSLTNDEKGYDPNLHLVDFIDKQTEEDNFTEVKKLQSLNINDFLEIIKKINKIIDSLKREINEASIKSRELLIETGLTEKHFYKKRGNIVSYLMKFSSHFNEDDLFPNNTVMDTINKDKWYAGKIDTIEKVAIDSIKDKLLENFYTIYNNKEKYYFLKKIYSKLHKVTLLNELSLLFDNYTDKTGKVHISDFNKRISNIISGEPVPFIYERLGVKFEHYLIDEFQDTSIMQWYNMLPLIENSLSSGNFNMLVGDPKQAIYRFRGGEVELFTSLPKFYGKTNIKDKEIREAVLKNNIKFKNLEINYRSYKEIIKFNNTFFDFIKKNKPGLISRIYEKHEQKESEKKNSGGYVSIELINSNNATDYETKRLGYIKNYIEELKNAGFKNKDICILTRTSKHGVQIASFLLENQIPVISSESMLVSTSPEVRSVVSFLKALIQPSNSVVISELLRNILLIVNRENEYNNLLMTLFQKSKTNLDTIIKYFNLDIDVSSLKQRTIYEIAGYIFNKINKAGVNNIYFQYFMDFVLEKENVHNNNIDSFVTLWEDKKEKLYIVIPEGEDAIQIMTIHKSKGLKFQAVILDYIERNTKNSKSEEWISPQIKETPELSTTLIPIKKPPKNIQEKNFTYNNINFTEIYEKEKWKTELDKINLMYVAFTRPVEALMILAETPKKNKKDGKISNSEYFSKIINQFIESGENYNKDKTHYHYGELRKIEKPQKISKNHFTLKSYKTSFEKLPINIAPVEEIYWEKGGGFSQKTKGKVIHAILSKIKTSKDIRKTLKHFQNKGVIDNNEYRVIKTEINKIVNHEKIKHYFSEKASVKTETEIITDSGDIIRPDRIVFYDEEITIIDYKTGDKKNKDIEQVKKYIHILKNIYKRKVNGLLIYIGENISIKEVN